MHTCVDVISKYNFYWTYKNNLLMSLFFQVYILFCEPFLLKKNMCRWMILLFWHEWFYCFSMNDFKLKILDEIAGADSKKWLVQFWSLNWKLLNIYEFWTAWRIQGVRACRVQVNCILPLLMLCCRETSAAHCYIQ